MIKRIAIGFSLILILLVLCSYYYNYHESYLEYPSTTAILSNYPEGSTVSVSGSVLRLNGNGFDLLDQNGRTEYKIESSERVKPTDNIQLIGILGPSYTIKSTKIVAETAGSYRFVLLRSSLALLFLIFIFLRYWKFNFQTFEFIRLKESRSFLNLNFKKKLRRQ